MRFVGVEWKNWLGICMKKVKREEGEDIDIEWSVFILLAFHVCSALLCSENHFNSSHYLNNQKENEKIFSNKLRTPCSYSLLPSFFPKNNNYKNESSLNFRFVINFNSRSISGNSHIYLCQSEFNLIMLARGLTFSLFLDLFNNKSKREIFINL